MDRKRLRVDRAELLRRIANSGGVSASGLADIIAELHGKPELLSDLHRARQSVGQVLLDQFDRVKQVVTLPRSGDCGEFHWEFIDPALLLSEVVRSNALVSAAYGEAVRQSRPSPDNPWDFVVGFDEFSPGNKLQSDNRRKVMVMSFTFRQLGGPRWATAICG